MIERPLHHIGTSGQWLRKRLATMGVRLHPASELARALDTLATFRARVLRGDVFSFDTTEAAYDFVGTAVGADFLSKALHWGSDSGFDIGANRYRDLVSGNPIVTKVGTHSTARNLTWEVIIASLASTFASGVVFDEPDVQCRFRGKTFAVAAKVAYSEPNLFENVEDGFHQANGKAEGAVVFADVVNVFPVVETLRWSRVRRFERNDEAVEAMTSAFGRWCDRFDLYGAARRLRERAQHPVGVAFFVPMFIEMSGQPVPMFYTHLPISWAGAEGVDYEFANEFLRACNVVLGFQPKAAS